MNIWQAMNLVCDEADLGPVNPSRLKQAVHVLENPKEDGDSRTGSGALVQRAVAASPDPERQPRKAGTPGYRDSQHASRVMKPKQFKQGN
jgi:hypothetical protein